VCSILSIFLSHAKGKYCPGDLPPRIAELVTGHAAPYVTMVMTDVQGSTRLWEWDSNAMASAITMHDTLMRKLLRRYSGYEVSCSREASLCCSAL
jgi:class 3 adenylate cyclase